MTVVTYPGELDLHSTIWQAIALLLPFSGVSKACHAIAYACLGEKNALKRALFAGALCEVVRDDGIDKWDPTVCKIHGRASLPPGFTFTMFRKQVEFTEFENFNCISSSHSIPKSVIAIFQLLFSCFTLYHTRGNQIALYGYAAFGLTVLPYTIMSLINLVATIVTPHYPTLYMVRTSMMIEAEGAGGRFEGVIANIENEHVVANSVNPPLRWRAIAIGSFGIIAPYIILAGFTGFAPGASTAMQRGFTMAWLVTGQIFGGWFTFMSLLEFHTTTKDYIMTILFYILVPIIPAIGGLVVVGQMLVVNGDCGSRIV